MSTAEPYVERKDVVEADAHCVDGAHFDPQMCYIDPAHLTVKFDQASFLGKGTGASVYRGTLDGKVVAVKRVRVCVCVCVRVCMHIISLFLFQLCCSGRLCDHVFVVVSSESACVVVVCMSSWHLSCTQHAQSHPASHTHTQIKTHTTHWALALTDLGVCVLCVDVGTASVHFDI
jgi:hypothetical protein